MALREVRGPMTLVRSLGSTILLKPTFMDPTATRGAISAYGTKWRASRATANCVSQREVKRANAPRNRACCLSIAASRSLASMRWPPAITADIRPADQAVSSGDVGLVRRSARLPSWMLPVSSTPKIRAASRLASFQHCVRGTPAVSNAEISVRVPGRRGLRAEPPQ